MIARSRVSKVTVSSSSTPERTDALETTDGVA
jgi:hypothetical protein